MTATMGPSDLKRARKLLGWTQESMADALEIHRVTLAKLETGVHPIDRRTEFAVKHLLRVSDSAAGEPEPTRDIVEFPCGCRKWVDGERCGYHVEHPDDAPFRSSDTPAVEDGGAIGVLRGIADADEGVAGKVASAYLLGYDRRTDTELEERKNV